MASIDGIFNKNIFFQDGLLGLEEYKTYVIEEIEENGVFYLLQNLEDEQLGIIVTNPFIFKEDYEIKLDDKLIEELEIKKEDEVLVVNTVTLGKNREDFTSNLMAPLIINVANSRGKQVILNDSKYKIKEKIFKE
ncbi:flagellar assembly protein FliW [Clostridium bornimense]|uniref:flagellar assembly protein FliW n=1 Tax=Clostridium bornimense TaxID=1216932 RepID=UPI001C0F8430|nr:flagellar assembly protein FliW [Clostridium bornimense]MBU5314807.1 flagellar assembly protein FliW [Clostridium bornimense]